MSSSAEQLQRRPPGPIITGQAVLRLRLIGQMEAWTSTSESVLPDGRKTRALLAVVALSAPRPALRGRLAELLWSRRPEEQARASLRQEIHRLLESLSFAGSEILMVTRDHLSLRPGAVWIDVEEVMRATTTEPASLSLLDGDLLEDLDGIDPTFDAWLTTERERLRDRARTVAEALLREQVEPEAAIPAAQRLLAIDRAHEGAWRALMRAHADRGERGMAIQAYDRCRAVLADCWTPAPSAETQKLLVGNPRPRRQPHAARDRVAPPVQLVPPPAAGAGRDRRDACRRRADHGRRSRIAAPRPTRRGARVGVMPLRLVGTTEEEAHLAPGLAEEITTALSRFRWMFVVSSSSLARFAQDNRDEAAIRRTFGIDFLLDGTIQRDARTVAHHAAAARSARRQPGGLGAALRPAGRRSAVAAGRDRLGSRGADRPGNSADRGASASPSRPVIDATAYDLVLRALPLMTRLEREPFMQAGSHLARAIETGAGIRRRACLVCLLACVPGRRRAGRTTRKR